MNEFSNLTINEFLDNFKQQLIVERLMQLMIQAAIDINDHILSKLNPGNSATNFEAFIELGKYGIINPQLAKQLAPSASLRNRLVHEYGDIDPNQVFTAITFALQRYPLYAEQMKAYLMSLDV